MSVRKGLSERGEDMKGKSHSWSLDLPRKPFPPTTRRRGTVVDTEAMMIGWIRWMEGDFMVRSSGWKWRVIYGFPTIASCLHRWRSEVEVVQTTQLGRGSGGVVKRCERREKAPTPCMYVCKLSLHYCIGIHSFIHAL